MNNDRSEMAADELFCFLPDLKRFRMLTVVLVTNHWSCHLSIFFVDIRIINSEPILYTSYRASDISPGKLTDEFILAVVTRATPTPMNAQFVVQKIGEFT